MLVVCRGGSLGLLNAQLSYLESLLLRLYVNDHVPGVTDTVADYTEATFPGYGLIVLTEWSTPALNGDGKAETVEAVRVFTATADGSLDAVFGYYVTDGSGNLVWAERVPLGPVAMTHAGDNFAVQPRLTDRSDPG